MIQLTRKGQTVMKKEYSKPTAEKVEFDYTESVVACSDKDWACWEREWQKQQQQQQ